MIHETTNIWGDGVIGTTTSIGAFCDIGNPNIGEGCKIQCHVSIPPGWTIGNKVFIGPGARFANDKHPDVDSDFEPEEGFVGDSAVIGMNATIGAGIIIGKGAVIGMGAVVTKNVEPFSTVVGNPARPI